ncbi:hypothetical protein FXN63_19700 [Pigmentiphaga aceris]|uniref:Uncharacterized protein n=1 Tax=Pigmentiphaga aceris TaxID=1940612 RepID=A0A5C0B3L2_9BURK|nr:hypothetical protein [Pigmentiphaga aceris]QEI07810.1 hypothetical protein FXN63_19700 [Pigmentiphaga aceris]
MSSRTLRSITFSIAMTKIALRLALTSGLVLLPAYASANASRTEQTVLSGDTVTGKITRSVPPAAESAPQAPSVATAPAPKPVVERASLLKGKIGFRLPAGFVGSQLPPGARMGNADVKGTVYGDPTHKQLIIAAEWRTPSGVRVKDDDHVFLERARADYIAQMQKSLPDYEIIGDKALRIKGIGIRQTEGISTFGQVRTLSTSLLAASGTTQAVVRIISRADDGRSHEALVANVLQAMRATR